MIPLNFFLTSAATTETSRPVRNMPGMASVTPIWLMNKAMRARHVVDYLVTRNHANRHAFPDNSNGTHFQVALEQGKNLFRRRFRHDRRDALQHFLQHMRAGNRLGAGAESLVVDHSMCHHSQGTHRSG